MGSAPLSAAIIRSGGSHEGVLAVRSINSVILISGEDEYGFPGPFAPAAPAGGSVAMA